MGRRVGVRDEGAEGRLCDEVVFADMLEGAGGATGDLDLGEVGGLAGRETLAGAGGRVLVDPEGCGWAGDVGLGGVGLESLAEGVDGAHRARGQGRRQRRRRGRRGRHSRVDRLRRETGRGRRETDERANHFKNPAVVALFNNAPLT